VSSVEEVVVEEEVVVVLMVMVVEEEVVVVVEEETDYDCYAGAIGCTLLARKSLDIQVRTRLRMCMNIFIVYRNEYICMSYTA